jgi:PIN domain nuclease of toxin-antitoxin system
MMDEREAPGQGAAGEHTPAVIDDREHEKWLSPISAWEALMLAPLGRLRDVPGVGVLPNA